MLIVFFVTQISQMTQILLAVFSFYLFTLLLFYSFTLLPFYSFTFLPFFFLIKVKTFCYKVFKNFKKALIINRLLAYFDFFLYLCKR